jgi:hypothetical protein
MDLAGLDALDRDELLVPASVAGVDYASAALVDPARCLGARVAAAELAEAQLDYAIFFSLSPSAS